MVTMPGPHIQEKLRQWDILAPIDPQIAAKWKPAPRLHSLHGKVAGFLGNRKANADLLLHDIKELLDKKFELQNSLVVDKFIYSRPAAPDVISGLSERCDFVVTAIAD